MLENLFYIVENKKVIKLSLKIFKTAAASLLTAGLLFIGLSLGYALEERAPSSKQEAAAKITELKKALSFAKGEKRSKIIKKIAEIENRLLERKTNSFGK